MAMEAKYPGDGRSGYYAKVREWAADVELNLGSLEQRIEELEAEIAGLRSQLEPVARPKQKAKSSPEGE